MEQVFSAVKEVLKELEVNSKAQEALVLAAWPDVVGEILRDRTHAISFADGRLVIEVQDVTWKRNLEHLAPQLLAKLNRSLIGVGVDFLDFKVSRSMAKRPNAVASNIADLGKLPSKVKTAAEGINDPRLRENFLAAAAVYLEKNK